MGDYLFFFLLLIFLIISLHFSPSILCSYIPAPDILNAHTHTHTQTHAHTHKHTLAHTNTRFGGHVLSKSEPVLLLVHPVSNSPSFKCTRQSQPELDVGHLVRMG